jgi:hypothetical protein
MAKPSRPTGVTISKWQGGRNKSGKKGTKNLYILPALLFSRSSKKEIKKEKPLMKYTPIGGLK